MDYQIFTAVDSTLAENGPDCTSLYCSSSARKFEAPAGSRYCGSTVIARIMGFVGSSVHLSEDSSEHLEVAADEGSGAYGLQDFSNLGGTRAGNTCSGLTFRELSADREHSRTHP